MGEKIKKGFGRSYGLNFPETNKLDGSVEIIVKDGVNKIVSHLEKYPLSKRQIKETEKELNKNPFYVLGKERGKLDIIEIIKKLKKQISINSRETQIFNIILERLGVSKW